MEFTLTHIERVVALLDELKEAYRQLLYQYNAVVAGNPNRLADNIADLVQIQGNTIKLGFTLPAEWKFIEEGTLPHWPPPQAIEDWVRLKPVQKYPLPNGKEPTDKQVAFLIGRKIATVGTEGKHLLEEAIIRTDFFNRMMRIIQNEMAEHANKEITQILMTL